MSYFDPLNISRGMCDFCNSLKNLVWIQIYPKNTEASVVGLQSSICQDLLFLKF